MYISKFLKVMGAVFFVLILVISTCIFFLNKEYYDQKKAVNRQAEFKQLGIDLDLKLMITLTTIALTLIFGLFLFMYIILTKKISKLVHISVRLSDLSNNEGDLTSRLDIKSKDEVGLIASSYNRMLETLHNLIKEVHQTVGSVVEVSDHLTSATKVITNKMGNIHQSTNPNFTRCSRTECNN